MLTNLSVEGRVLTVNCTSQSLLEADTVKVI